MSKSSKAREFLKEHNIEGTVADMINTLCHSHGSGDEHSNKPLLFMIKYLTGLLTEEERNSNGINIAEPYPTKYIKKKKEGKTDEMKNEGEAEHKAEEGRNVEEKKVNEDNDMEKKENNDEEGDNQSEKDDVEVIQGES